MSIYDELPQLTTTNSSITSPEDSTYNCIGWAMGENDRLWWPDVYKQAFWPRTAPLEETIEAFKLAFSTKGYEDCANPSLEDGFEKIAIYTNMAGKVTHAARQLLTGKWTSKLGLSHDITHDTPEVVGGFTKQGYGQVVAYMRRIRRRG